MKGLLLTTAILTEKTAASKARMDVREILQQAGYEKVALPDKFGLLSIINLWRTFSLVLEKDAHVIIEYPFKARWRLYPTYIVCRFRGIKLYGIVHDIGSLRKRTAPVKDMVIIRLFDGLVSHNASMTAWLRKKGFRKKIVNLEVFDYLLKNNKSFAQPQLLPTLKIVYAGHLGYHKATYLYDMPSNDDKRVELNLYGQFFEKEKVTGCLPIYKGVFDPGKPDLKENYHFGLIWEGTSTDTCKGVLGEYTRYNNPHKFSLYIALELPVIVWREAAIAPFVIENQLGLVIDSLDDLPNLDDKLNQEAYQLYMTNVSRMAKKVTTGHFLLDAVVTRLVPDPRRKHLRTEVSLDDE